MSPQPPPATYRDTFDCLWCGTSWSTRGPDDLEGWARLCPDCLGKAGANPFLRTRLRRALAARAGAGQAMTPAGAAAGGRPAPAAFPDDWFLRRGPFERGAIHDAAWAAELDMATRWLDGLRLRGRLVEPAAGVGFFSPLLAEAGELFAFDTDSHALDRARDRLAAHRLRAHLHIADAWAPPAVDPGPADGLLAAFLLGRVRGAGLDPAVEALAARLAPHGRLAVLDLLPDHDGGPPPGTAWTWHAPDVVEASLRRAGLSHVDVSTTGRFFLLATGLR
jgi:SAM-dependent methyltransferase